MAKGQGFGQKVMVTVISVKGHCNAGHQAGDAFEVSILNPSKMCGTFYHHTYPTISTLQFGGNYPWFPEENVAMAACPDPMNQVMIKLVKSNREE